MPELVCVPPGVVWLTAIVTLPPDGAETVSPAACQVAFRLESDGRCLFDLPVQDRPARVAALLGPDAAPEEKDPALS